MMAHATSTTSAITQKGMRSCRKTPISDVFSQAEVRDHPLVLRGGCHGILLRHTRGVILTADTNQNH